MKKKVTFNENVQVYVIPRESRRGVHATNFKQTQLVRATNFKQICLKFNQMQANITNK